MIQDIEPHRFRNEYRHIRPQDTDLCLAYKNGSVLMRQQEGQISYPTVGLLGLNRNQDRIIYAFSVDETPIFLCLEDVPEVDGFTYEPMSLLRSGHPRELAYAGIVGRHLDAWYRDNVYCGRCGSRLIHDGKERMMRCPACANLVYPKICPAVIVCLRHENQVLLTKYANGEYKRYALIAGFTEIGETVEETVAREVMEEVGLRVKNLEYYKSQPWGFSGGLLLGFFCEVDGETAVTLDTDELSVAEWVDVEKLRDMDDGASLTREMMRVAYERYNVTESCSPRKSGIQSRCCGS